MKKLLLGSALALSTLAVVVPTQSAMAQEVATVGSVGKGISWLAQRIYSIDVGTHAYDMTKDGVTTRDYVAVFNISGAMVQNFELVDSKEGLEEVGRKPGIQILPYKVSISSDGRKFISVGAFSLKEANKAYGNVSDGNYNFDGDGTWSVINQLDAVIYEYDDSLMISNTETHRLDIVRGEVKVDILGSSKPGHFLAVVGQGSMGWEKQIVRTGDDVFSITDSDDEEDKGMGFNAKYGIGLEYNLPVSSKGVLNAKMMLQGGRLGGYNYSKADANAVAQINATGQAEVDQINTTNVAAYDQQLEQYYIDKALYEQENLEGVEISDDSYYSITGSALPILPDAIKYNGVGYNAPRTARTYMYLAPNVSYTGKLGEKTKFEINVFGNIPLRDDLNTSGVKLDLTGTNARPIIGAGLKLKF